MVKKSTPGWQQDIHFPAEQTRVLSRAAINKGALKTKMKQGRKRNRKACVKKGLTFLFPQGNAWFFTGFWAGDERTQQRLINPIAPAYIP